MRTALGRGLPVLGICRGAQSLNVARGGTLHQHLPELTGDRVAHRQLDDARRPTHRVAVSPGSRLAGVLRVTELRVNSFHHQAVDRLGAGLRVSARAPDGTVEAIEDPALPFVLAVQWHAETLAERATERRLFAALVATAAASGALARAA